MHKLFLYLLKRFTRTERERLEILHHLWQGVYQDYFEQNMPGNIHNMTIEMTLSNEWIRQLVLTGDELTLQIVRNCVNSGIVDGIRQLAEESKESQEQPKELHFQ